MQKDISEQALTIRYALQGTRSLLYLRSQAWPPLTSASDPHPHHRCHRLTADGALRKPLAARSTHAPVAAGDEGVRLVLIKAHDARVAVGILHLLTRRALLGDLVD